MIKTFSPHYKTIPWLSPSSGIIPNKYVLNIYVWSGLKANIPASPTFEIENVNPLGKVGNSEVDISKYISGDISNNLNNNTITSISDSNSMVWVKTEVIYYIDNVAQTPEFEEIDSAVLGYAYGIEGVNTTTPLNGYLATTIEQKVNTKGGYIFNFLASETESTVIRLESENVTKEFTKTATTDSSELIQSCYVNVSEFDGDYIEIYKDNVLINTLIITTEQRYTPIDIVFLNKEGQHQTVVLFKEKIAKLKVSKKEFESSEGQPLNGIHQFKNYSVNGNESFSVNSGFVKEDNNEIFTQLMLSRDVWELKDGVYIPLNLSINDIEYKTRQRDRLINYKIDFKYSFSKVNNI